jgi:hypothetical protein
MKLIEAHPLLRGEPIDKLAFETYQKIVTDSEGEDTKAPETFVYQKEEIQPNI